MQWRNSTVVVRYGMDWPSPPGSMSSPTAQTGHQAQGLTARKGVPPPPVFPSNYQGAVSYVRLLRGDGDTPISMAFCSSHWSLFISAENRGMNTYKNELILYLVSVFSITTKRRGLTWNLFSCFIFSPFPSGDFSRANRIQQAQLRSCFFHAAWLLTWNICSEVLRKAPHFWYSEVSTNTKPLLSLLKQSSALQNWTGAGLLHQPSPTVAVKESCAFSHFQQKP